MEAFSISLKDGEEVVSLYRKHKTVLTPAIIKGLLLIVILLLFANYLLAFWFLGIVMVAVIAFGILYIIWSVYSWYFDVCVLTNLRVIRVDQRSVVNKEVRDIEYGSIQKATYAIKGASATAFNYGVVKIYTDIDKDPIEINGIHRPESVRDQIIEIKEKVGESEEGELSAQELIKFIGQIKDERINKIQRETDDRQVPVKEVEEEPDKAETEE